MTNANVEKKEKEKERKKDQQHKSYTAVNNCRKCNEHRGIKEFLQKVYTDIWHMCLSVSLSCLSVPPTPTFAVNVAMVPAAVADATRVTRRVRRLIEKNPHMGNAV